MKDFLNKIRDFNKEDGDNSTQKTIMFFAFYLVFFAILFGVIIFGGDKNYLHQEYEKGNNSFNNKGVLNKNFVYDYKITKDEVLYDYYGKRYGDVESFKYNNEDYYRDKNEYFVNKNPWTKCDNPYQFYEFIDFENLAMIISKATFMVKKDLDSGGVEYHYLITNNTLNQILYNENTDYDDDADSIDIVTDSSNNVSKITYQLEHFCSRRNNCNTLTIEMNFEMFGSVTKIDNPIA